MGLALIGCSPLQQAPLVYSSKVVFGIDVSTPSSEQPGGSINIGYKLVDAAYVPVAVAKECKSGQNCEGSTYEMKIISGRSSDGSDTTSNDGGKNADRIQELTTRLAKVTDELREAELAKTVANEQSVVDSYQFDPGQNPDIETAEQNVRAKEDEVKKVVQELKSSLFLDQLDSYSVFGSFDSKTTANTDPSATVKADLNLGKVFSTGVAAQNITKGLGEQFSKSACLSSALRLASEYKSTAAVNTQEEKNAYGKFMEILVASCDSD
tara:strand:+ start:1660 stop:2460 length:801 start_codon:yes stop_codon:yes gene_type:complete